MAESDAETPTLLDQREAEATQEAEAPQQPDASLLELEIARLRAVVSAHMPEGTDLDEELGHVGGLGIEDGKVVGEAKYRKAEQAPAAPAEEEKPTTTTRRPAPPRPQARKVEKQTRSGMAAEMRKDFGKAGEGVGIKWDDAMGDF